MKKQLIAVMAAALLAGCSSKPQTQAMVTDSDPAVLALNESAMRIARSAEQAALALSVSGKSKRVTEEYQIDLSRVPAELREPMLLEGGFHGELEVFLRSLTDAVGWLPPVILGNKPSTPLMVSFTEQRRPAVHWFADAGYQSSELAKVTINSSLKQVVLQYREAGGIR